MRYSIMLQLVVTITVFFLSVAAMFAWLQCRPGKKGESTRNAPAIYELICIQNGMIAGHILNAQSSEASCFYQQS